MRRETGNEGTRGGVWCVCGGVGWVGGWEGGPRQFKGGQRRKRGERGLQPSGQDARKKKNSLVEPDFFFSLFLQQRALCPPFIASRGAFPPLAPSPSGLGHCECLRRHSPPFFLEKKLWSRARRGGFLLPSLSRRSPANRKITSLSNARARPVPVFSHPFSRLSHATSGITRSNPTPGTENERAARREEGKNRSLIF